MSAATINWTKSTTNRPIKVALRNLVAKVARKGKRRAILFPATTGEDILALRRTGVLTKDTLPFVVERNKVCMDILQKNARKLFPTGAFYHNAPMHKLPLAGPVDFAWFDFLGNLTKHDAEWIAEHIAYLTGRNTDLFFTFAQTDRAASREEENFHGLMAQVENKVPAHVIDRFPLPESFNGETQKVAEDGTIYTEKATDACIRAIKIKLMALSFLFRGFTYDVSVLASYKDREAGKGTKGAPMFLIHLSCFKRRGAGRPPVFYSLVA